MRISASPTRVGRNERTRAETQSAGFFGTQCWHPFLKDYSCAAVFSRYADCSQSPAPGSLRSPGSPARPSSPLRRAPAPPVRSAKPRQGPVASLPLHLDPALLRPPPATGFRPPTAASGSISLSERRGGLLPAGDSSKPPPLPERFPLRGMVNSNFSLDTRD